MSIEQKYIDTHPRSRMLHARATAVFPDGVTHDIRREVPFPMYCDQAAGSRKRDVDGHEIVDYVMGHGALMLGHRYPAIEEAVRAQLGRGTHYGASHEVEIAWGELVLELVPSAERVRFLSSGTEATMMAVRLARQFTGREKLLRLHENFHGWNDSVTGQPAAEETVPASPGIPRGMLVASIVIPQNDVEALERTFDEEGADIAAVIFEATGAHWGTEPIDIDYVQRIRDLTRERGAVMIMDEVITGFRVSPGGAQQVYGIIPDLTTLAKIVAGGLPGAAVAGRAEILDQISFTGRNESQRIAHPGTFNANPISAAAGSTCLATLRDGTHQERASALAAKLARAMNAALREESFAGQVYGASSMLHIALGSAEQPPDGYSWGWRAAPASVTDRTAGRGRALRLGMLNEGVALMGSGLMVSSAHDEADVATTVDAFRKTLSALKDEGLG